MGPSSASLSSSSFFSSLFFAQACRSSQFGRHHRRYQAKPLRWSDILLTHQYKALWTSIIMEMSGVVTIRNQIYDSQIDYSQLTYPSLLHLSVRSPSYTKRGQLPLWAQFKNCIRETVKQFLNNNTSQSSASTSMTRFAVKPIDVYNYHVATVPHNIDKNAA